MSKTLSREHIEEAIRTRKKCECGAGYIQEGGFPLPCPNPKCRHGQGIGNPLPINRFGDHPPGTPAAYSREKCFLEKGPDARIFWLWEPVR